MLNAKECSKCKQSKERTGFGVGQLDAKEDVRECLECKPINEKLRKRKLDDKECKGCGVGKPRCEYTDTQWNKGAQSKCKGCINEAALAEKNRDRQCNTCGVTKVRGEFSITQWDDSTHTKNGSKCKECCEKIFGGHTMGERGRRSLPLARARRPKHQMALLM